MIDTTISHVTNVLQDTREGVMVSSNTTGHHSHDDISESPVFRSVLYDVIMEYGQSQDNTFYINLRDVELWDRKILLSNLVSAEEYELALSTPSMFTEIFREYSDYIQKRLDEESHYAWLEYADHMRNIWDD